MSTRLRIGILGATGSVGQKLVLLLREHPWFEVTAVAASERSLGSRYRDAVHWLEAGAPPERTGELTVSPPRPPLACDAVLSALDAAVAAEVEPAFAAAGYPVISNASAHRMDARVPLLVPEVNPDHVALIEDVPPGAGFIVTNPNCCVAGLVLALKPIADAFGIEAVQVTTLQAASGAGYPGVPALDILGNAVPFIANEEEKIQSEPRKIFGRLENGGIAPAAMRISAQANRVPVVDGHLLSVSVALRRSAPVEKLAEAFRSFRGPLAGLGLPSAPERPVVLLEDGPRPQPRLHAAAGDGMVVTVGRLRPCPVLDARFVVLVHNTVRGAAGAAVLNAEFLAARGLLRPRA